MIIAWFCNILRNRLWRHPKNKGRTICCVTNIALSFCRVRNVVIYVLSHETVYVQSWISLSLVLALSKPSSPMHSIQSASTHKSHIYIYIYIYIYICGRVFIILTGICCFLPTSRLTGKIKLFAATNQCLCRYLPLLVARYIQDMIYKCLGLFNILYSMKNYPHPIHQRL